MPSIPYQSAVPSHVSLRNRFFVFMRIHARQALRIGALLFLPTAILGWYCLVSVAQLPTQQGLRLSNPSGGPILQARSSAQLEGSTAPVAHETVSRNPEPAVSVTQHSKLQVNGQAVPVPQNGTYSTTLRSANSTTAVSVSSHTTSTQEHSASADVSLHVTSTTKVDANERASP